MLYSELQSILDSFTSTSLGKYPHRYIFFDLNAKYNASLRELLHTDGYWDWAPARSKVLVSAHQLVAFYCTPHPATGGDFVEVHHINGNSTDNRPSNLIYLTPADHALVTKHQRHYSKLSLKLFSKIQDGLPRYSFNRRGARVRSWAHFILMVIALTVSKTLTWVHAYSPVKHPLPKGRSHAAQRSIKGAIHNILRALLAMAPSSQDALSILTPAPLPCREC
jgi:hypothetical protein